MTQFIPSRRFFLASALTSLAGAQVASESFQRVDSNEISADLITPEVKRVGMRLRCLCGCAMTVGDCNMVGCHYASPSREKIRSMLQSGMSDDEIIAAFVKEEGIKVLAAPPATGFNWFGYSAPYILGGIGAVVVGLVLKRMVRPAAAPAVPEGAPPVTQAELEKYEKVAAHDIEEFED